MEDFEELLRREFIEEARQLLNDSEAFYLKLEANPKQSDLLDEIFRLAHNLKGSAKAVGQSAVVELSHAMESVLLRVKRSELELNPDRISLLLRCTDRLRQMIQELANHKSIETSGDDLIAFLKGEKSEPSVTVKQTPRASSKVFPPLFLAAQSAPPALVDDSFRVSADRVEKLMDLVGELVILNSALTSEMESVSSDRLVRVTRELRKRTKEVQELSMGLRLVSLKPLFQRLERAARDLSRDLNKPLDVHFEGETVEVDKTVLEKLTDPLIHILRNAVDHGLESSQDREATGKPLRGTLLFKAVQNAGRLVFEISDDGKGLDSELLKKIAIEKGLIDPQTQLSVSESYQLMFRAGFSTKEKVTEISGRGIGLDVVKHNIERLNGEIQVRSEVGKGTTFVIRLPQSLAIIEGMVVWAGGERFVVPAAYIDETVASKELDLRSVDGAHSQHIQLRNELIPVYDLPSLLGLTPSVESPEAIVLVCRQLSVPFALRVDDVVGQQSVVTKRLGVELSKIKGVSGSAILGDGRPCLILELPDLMSDSLAAEAENRSHENKAPSPGRTV